MTMMDDGKGAKKAPNKTSWKKGQSGNPMGYNGKGAQAGDAQKAPSLTLPEHVNDELAELVPMKIDQTTQMLPAAKVIAKRAAHLAMKCQTPLELKYCIDALIKLGVLKRPCSCKAAGESDEEPYHDIFTEEDRRIMQIARDIMGDEDDDEGYPGNEAFG